VIRNHKDKTAKAPLVSHLSKTERGDKERQKV
jgi:hypothetical protein